MGKKPTRSLKQSVKKMVKARPALPPFAEAAFYLGLAFALAAVAGVVAEVGKPLLFFDVLSTVLRDGGSYETLLAAIIVAVAFQSHAAAEKKRKETERKIKELGQYTIAFKREDDDEQVVSCGDIIAAREKGDFAKGIETIDKDKDFISTSVKFLTSGKKSTNLQCILAFEEEYFKDEQKKIIQDYYKYCQMASLQNPLYLAARQTNPELRCESRNRYVTLHLRKPAGGSPYKSLWISAITDQGVLLLIKVKLLVKEEGPEEGKAGPCKLIGQYSYATENNDVKALYF